jgi:hypothetical protein
MMVQDPGERCKQFRETEDFINDFHLKRPNAPFQVPLLACVNHLCPKSGETCIG